jgi:rare lipoprotein A
MWESKMATALLVTTGCTMLVLASNAWAETGKPSAPANAKESVAASYPSVFEHGPASWYEDGERTANGEEFEPEAMTAAHRTLPLGTLVKVVHPETDRSVVVRVNDRGPYVRGRVIDLSRGAARALGVEGVAPVTIHGLGDGREAEE